MLINKIKKHGIIGSVNIVLIKIAHLINDINYYICWIFSVNNNLIVLESEGDICDNSYALYDYMKKNDYLNKYKVVWLVDDVNNAKKNKWPNTDFCTKIPKNIQFKRSKYLATCKYYIFDHCNVVDNLLKRKEQLNVNLCHGLGFKAPKGSNNYPKTRPDLLVATGPFAAKGVSLCQNEPLDKIKTLGYPRIDYLFNTETEDIDLIKSKFKLNNFNKILLWMPTFRKSNNDSISENYLDEGTGLPLMDTKVKYLDFNSYLKEKNIICILKIHHLQSEMDVFKENFSNIKILKDDELKNLGIQLYQFIPVSDCLMTDYSSISNDYLVLNKPIIYMLDDYDKYNLSRGFYLDNTKDYMKGYHVYTINELKSSIDEITKGIDKYNVERKNITHLYHSYLDGDASKRILKELNIKI